MDALLKNARIAKNLKIKEVASKASIDQALISKFEKGTRKPTKAQLAVLADVLGIDYDKLYIAWLKEKILYEITEDTFGLEALKLAEKEIQYKMETAKKAASPINASLLQEIDTLKVKLDQLREFDSFRIAQAIDLEYTYESNRIEGNTLTLRETDLVINQGLTVSGKSMREHLEAINHTEAIAFVKEFIQNKTPIKESDVLQIHNLILRGILPEDAGKYRSVQVMIQGSKHMPPQPYLVAKQMEGLYHWYQQNKTVLHPVVLAAEMHQRLVTIHPFVDGNGRTSRLVMNLILLQHGYVIANIKGDFDSRMNYYQALEDSQKGSNKEPFIHFVMEVEKECLERYLSILNP